MKAIRVAEFGEPSVLQVAEVPEPRPVPGKVLVRLHAAGVNPIEAYQRSGKYARLPALPWTPGTDGAGRVVDAGGTDAPATGERVYLSGALTGTYAELALCEASDVHRLPESVSFAQGAALGVSYATAYRALFQRGGAAAGETVLIHGATGGTGLAALQWARRAGLRVFATGGTEAGRALLQREGAEAVFDHHAPDLAEALRQKTEGHGVALIVEMLANVNLGRDLALLAPRGRVVVIGSRGPVEINPRDAMMREADIRGVTLFMASPEEQAAVHRALGEGLADGTLRPVVNRQFPLAEAAAAHGAVMAGGALGKLVLVL